jgi:hypothetical protein
MKKIVATVLAAALAASTVSVPAYATTDNKNKTGVGILPALAGPAFLAHSISGLHTSHWTVVKNFKFYKWQNWGWQKVNYLKYQGYDVTKKVYGHKVKVHAEKHKHSTRGSDQGAYIVGCIMGSALGAISAAIRKGNALGNPIRWRSQAEHEQIVRSGYEKQFELTNDEAATALAFCGLGSFALRWEQKAAPAVVKAKF